MQELYRRFPEKNKRHLILAGTEAFKLPYGGISYIARLLGCSRDTIRTGIKSWVRKMNSPAIEIEMQMAVESQRWIVMRLLMKYSWLFCKNIRQATP